MTPHNVSQGPGADVTTEAEVSEVPSLDPRPWDHSDPFFSASTRDLLQWLLKCYVRQVLVFVGIPANALCCLVFFKQGLSERINLLLFWLSVADLSTLLVQLLVMPGCYLTDPTDLSNWSVVVNGKVGFVNWYISHVSGVLIVVVSMDRCLSVALPFTAKTLLQYRMMVMAIIASYLFPLTYFLPSLLAYTIGWRTDPATNRSTAYTTDTPWFPVTRATAVSVWNSGNLVCRPLLLAVMVFCCGVTVLCLQRASRSRGQLVGGGAVKGPGDGRDRRITKMLLFLCAIYTVFLLPDVTSSIVVQFVPEYFAFRRYHNTHIVVYQYLWIASCLNSTANFFVYLVLSSRFQRTLKELCCCHCSEWTCLRRN